MSNRFPSFPPCCQQLLEDLITEGKTGARNCAKGHALSLEYARMVEARAAEKARQEAAKAAT
jgi:hypothetical protein